MRVWLRAAATALAAGVCLVVVGPPVQADSGRLRVEMPDGAVSLPKLAPGFGGTTDVRVVNDSATSADLVLRAVDVVDDENTCLRQETRDGDVTCDPDGGELSSWLQIAVMTGGSVVWQGSMADLVTGVAIAHDLPAGETLPLEVGVELPFSAGNDTMTDRVEFGLRWTATAVTGESDTEILGVDAFAGGLPGAGVPLPFTGATVEPWLLWFAGVLLAGGCVLLAASRSQVRPAF